MGAAALQLTGIGAVFFYAPTFFAASGYDQKILGTVFLLAWNLVATLIAPLVIDKVGRRALLISTLLAMAVSMFALAPAVGYITDNGMKAAICFACLGVFVLAFEMGIGSVFWVVCNEIFPSEVAPVAFSICNFFQWVFLLMITFLFPPMHEKIAHWVFWILAVPGLISALYNFCLLPETRGRSKEDIQRDLRGQKGPASGYGADPSFASPKALQPRFQSPPSPAALKSPQLAELTDKARGALSPASDRALAPGGK